MSTPYAIAVAVSPEHRGEVADALELILAAFPDRASHRHAMIAQVVDHLRAMAA